VQTDVLILGCGIAGATTALRLAEDRQRQITLVTREDRPLESNSSYAQGGIVAAGEKDSPELLAEDVLRAGAGLSNPEAVELLAREGPELLQRILIDGTKLDFDKDDDGNLLFGLEGAHSRRRILHVGDATGRAIMRKLLGDVAQRPNIRLLTRQTAVDLITFPHHATRPLAVYEPLSCHGAYLMQQEGGEVAPIVASATVLATGGLGQIYLNTSNPAGSRGDGLAMAYRAGARVINTEFVQFHPTTLHMPGPTKFLISEAVRGEGAVLLTPDGEPFIERYSPDWRELAPRDVVARAIYWEMLANGYPYVLLDIASKKKAEYIKQRFPEIYAKCLEQNVDITSQPIPVVPAAHYFCGGVMVDLWGRSTMPGLYAVGEVACSGVHGANRLASTSLLEGLVWGSRAADRIRQDDERGSIDENDIPRWSVSGLRYEADPALIQGDMETIRNLMWHYVGLVRSSYRLSRAIRELTSLLLNIEDFYRKTRLTDDLIGLRNGVQAALIVARAAHINRTSRGCHYREDSLQTPAGSPPVANDQLQPQSGQRGS
jgi:L-aspartate oxidase